MRTFASDNNAPAAPEILAAVNEANAGDAISYGDDPLTVRAAGTLREIFGDGTQCYFTFNGTGANVIALASLLQPYEAVICPESAHLQTDECGAFERFAGAKVLTVAGLDGKISPADLERFAGKTPDEHHSTPRAISISQSTEFGTLYTLQELRTLCDFAHAQGWFVHVDGARIANAAAALGCGLRACTRDTGVDVLTFGGTKNGLLFGECVLFFGERASGAAVPFVRKQAMQLASKMRFIAAQFEALLAQERWLQYARHANAMTARLEQRVRDIPPVRITRPVACNAIFATLDRRHIEPLQREYFFYVFDDALPEVRWMTHHATRPEDVDAFADAIARITA